MEFCAEHGIPGEEVPWIERADGDGLVPKEDFFAQVRERYGLKDSVAQLWSRYRERHPALVPACAGALEGLRSLRQAGWRTGVVSNGFADVQCRTLTHSGVAEQVDAWAVSGAEGVRKPGRRLFEIAARRCGAALGDGGWMVGDSPMADVVGGRGAGLRTVWIDRGRPWPAKLPAPDHSVGDVREAFVLLSG
ncbi:HAD family hydrolase [Nocardiopsis metallicus]|uniref:FMN phosphatase YigB (HAD superfamily) n=1 Tax=Nocardiopsis metallicus TaxID=179819 RepID=A0A840WG67_9ACTN|nr:HAD family hydrolase [Nocardiopsis metallicus]MBB5492001.1 FMN phosphatase YigB (HAD superfamily) [Nocardiopsis metallicus]